MNVKSHRTRPGRRPAWLIAALLLAMPVGGVAAAERSEGQAASAGPTAGSHPPPSGESAAGPASPEIAAQVDRLIAQLGDPAYAVRQAAQERLHALPIEAGRRLLAHYRRTDDAEVRMRIELYAEHYFREHVLPQHLPPPPAFLGVELQAAPRRGGGAAAQIARVLGGTAADRAGLQATDLVLGFRGHPLPADTPVQTLIDGIRDLRAGDTARFTIQRGDETFEQRITLGRRTPDLQDPAHREQLAEFREALHDRWWREAFLTGRLTLPPDSPDPPDPPDPRKQHNDSTSPPDAAEPSRPTPTD